MAGIIVDVIFGAIGLGLDFKGGNDIFNCLNYEFINDVMYKTTLPNTCALILEGQPGTVDPSVIAVSTSVRCGDDFRITGSWLNPKAGDSLTFTDDRVGTITVTFEADKFSHYPFPGFALVGGTTWHERGWGDSITLGDCILLSQQGAIIGKDCNGKDQQASLCEEGFLDGFQGVINTENINAHGWGQAIALPQNGVNLLCNNDAKKLLKKEAEPMTPAPKIKRALSRFQID